MSERLSCGHPVECASEMLPDFLGDTPATQRIGTVYCRWCADIAQAEAKAKALMDALREYYAAAKERRVRVKKLEEALQHISSAPCLYELLGEPPTDAEGEPAACECPGCVARRVLRGEDE